MPELLFNIFISIKATASLKATWFDRLDTDPYADMTSQTVKYTSFGAGMNLVQWKFRCCGVEAVNDYFNNTNWPKNDSVRLSFRPGRRR